MKYMVFDVESIGLHGEGFAVGFVVVDDCGNLLDENMFACPPQSAQGTVNDMEWVKENIPLIITEYQSPKEVRERFWGRFQYWKKEGAILAADCAWPVEARFLIACIEDDKTERSWDGPYPLHDLASILLARKQDPTGKFPRHRDELPEHNPLNDARQSARILLGAINE